MTDTFQTRMPGLSDAELRTYLQWPGKYKTEAVEAAMAELARRGVDLSEFDPAALRKRLNQRDAAKLQRPRHHGFLHDGARPRTGRIQAITVAILLAGLGSSAAIYRAAAASAASIDLESPNSKKYLRDLELIGGKANVVASDLRRGFAGLWEGKNLAGTVAVLTLMLAAGFWRIGTRD